MARSSRRRVAMDGRRILITGGAGFIGSHLVERLSGRNRVTVLDDLSTGSLQNLSSVREELPLKRASILQPKVLATAMKAQASAITFRPMSPSPWAAQSPGKNCRMTEEDPPTN